MSLNFRDGLALIVWLFSIAYCCLIPEQSDFGLLMAGLLPAFASYAYLALRGKASSFIWIVIVAIIGRLIATWGFPNLSDDVYRFIWDGRLWNLGIHPMSSLPSDLVGSHSSLDQGLFDELNSQDYYSIYPPIPQFIFWMSTFFSSLEWAATSMQLVHALSIQRKKNILAGIFLGAAIATKILPALFVPVLFFYLRGTQRWLFASTVAVSTIILFSPILMEMEVVSNIMSSADLYMRKFEFNASVYYVYRAIGYFCYGFNLIHVLGPVLTVSTLIIILCLSLVPFKKKLSFQGLVTVMMMSFLVYLFLSATVHPWYVGTIIALCIFTRYRTPLIWGALIFLTYANYIHPIYHEHLWLVTIEYIFVFGLIFYEIRKNKGFRLIRWS